MNASQLNAFVDELVEMGTIAPEVANKLKLVGDAGDNLNKIPTNADLAVSALQGVATAAGSISSAVSGIKMFVSAFEEGVSPLDATMSILSSITMVMPALIAAYKAIIAVKKAKKILDEADQEASLKTIANNSAETTSYWALAVAKWAAAHPALAIGAVAGIAAITAAIAIWTGVTNKQREEQKKLNEETITATEKANEASAAWEEQSSQVDGLIAKYKDLAATGADVKAIQDDLKSSAEDLTAAYVKMGEVFNAITSKDYKDMSGETISYAEAVK